jgi:hypothetical protein
MSRTYLYVSYEEREEARALGASWDAAAKCWYIEAAQEWASFRRWLGDVRSEEFSIRSGEAYVVSARAVCCRCAASIEVVCIYCAKGEVNGESQRAFTVSNITGVDAVLQGQLGRWPSFCFDTTAAASLLNHCPHCGAIQPEELLHDEPGGPFFELRGPADRALRYEPLSGCICLTGDEGFEP